jgi:hypothetical protein
MGKRYVKLERNQASIIQDGYSCALCWSPIRVCHDKIGDYLTCGDDNCRCEGLIKTSSIEYLIQKNELFSKQAREILQNQFEWLRLPKRKKLTIGENMKELGF